MTTCLPLLLLALPVAGLAEPPRPAEFPVPATALAGTWSTTWTVTGPLTCTGTPVGSVTTTTWVVTVAGDNQVTIDATGNTSFPRLTGTWNPLERELVLEAKKTALVGESAACWFDLRYENGELRGIRRFLGVACFIDGNFVAKRQ